MPLKATPTVDLEPTAFEAAEIAEETMAGMQAEIDRLTAESARLQSLIGRYGLHVKDVIGSTFLPGHKIEAQTAITPEDADEIRGYIDAKRAGHV